MSKLQNILPFDFVVDRFVDFILPKEEDIDLKPEVKTACLDLGRDIFIFWYKSLKKNFDVMRKRSLTDFNDIFVVAGDGDLNLKPGVEYVVNRDKLPFKLIENCSHLYPLQKKEDFHIYLHSILD